MLCYCLFFFSVSNIFFIVNIAFLLWTREQPSTWNQNETVVEISELWPKMKEAVFFCFFKISFDFIGVGYGRLVQHWTRTDNQEVKSSNPIDWPLSLFKCKKKKNIAFLYPNKIVFAASQFCKIYYTQNKIKIYRCLFVLAQQKSIS